MTQDFEESARDFLSLLNKLPSTPSITFRGFVDTSITQARIVVSPALTATSHSIVIATNNLRWPHVGVVVGANGRDLTALMAGAPTVNLQEVTYLPGTYFCQHPAQEFAGVMIQVYEEMCVSEDGTSLNAARPLDSWDPILAVLEPALRDARAASPCLRGPRTVSWSPSSNDRQRSPGRQRHAARDYLPVVSGARGRTSAHSGADSPSHTRVVYGIATFSPGA